MPYLSRNFIRFFFSKTRNESGQNYGYDFGKFDFPEMFITATVVCKNKAKQQDILMNLCHDY